MDLADAKALTGEEETEWRDRQGQNAEDPQVVQGLPRSGNLGEYARNTDLLKQFSIPIVIKPGSHKE